MLPARDVFEFSDEMQMQVIWNAILSSYYNIGSPGDNLICQPPPMGNANDYFVSVNFKVTPPVVSVLQSLGYTVQLTDADAPEFSDHQAYNGDYIKNGSDICGHTTISWNVGARFPLFNWVSGSATVAPQYI